MKKLAPEYPKDISGTVVFSADTSLDLPEVTIHYLSTVNSKNERQVVSVTVSYSNREPDIDKCVEFSEGRITADFDSDKSPCSLTFNSVNDLVDLNTGENKFNTSLEKYIEDTQDIELLLLMQIGLQFWGTMMDIFPLVDICGALIKGTLTAADVPDLAGTEDETDDEDNEDDDIISLD